MVFFCHSTGSDNGDHDEQTAPPTEDSKIDADDVATGSVEEKIEENEEDTEEAPLIKEQQPMKKTANVAQAQTVAVK